jgi:hypothetical protein
MPIKPENRKRYPSNWGHIRLRILERAGNKCELCGIPNHAFRWSEGGREYWTDDPLYAETLELVDGFKVTGIVLTVMHLNHTPEDCSDDNLRAACPEVPFTSRPRTSHAQRSADAAQAQSQRRFI